MTVGTKSLLYGIHQFILHPLLLAMAWKRLYGHPFSFKLWCCFFLHDIGYLGCTDMDSDEIGQRHPELGAKIIGKLFGQDWHDFCLLHSRFYAKTLKRSHSKLCCVDKLAFCFYPPRLYCFLARLSGEMEFYREFSKDANGFSDADKMTDLEWYHKLKRYTLRVVISTNRTYYNYVDIGRHYHSIDYQTDRLAEGSTRGRKPVQNRDNKTCRLWERSRNRVKNYDVKIN